LNFFAKILYKGEMVGARAEIFEKPELHKNGPALQHCQTPEVLFVKNLTLDFWGRIEHFLLMNIVNPVQFYLRNPGLNLDPGSTNSSRIAPQSSHRRAHRPEVVILVENFHRQGRVLKLTLNFVGRSPCLSLIEIDL
jgi:hypothetical protein